MLPQPETKSDGELDSDSYPGEPDNDNNHVYGHVASTAEARIAAELVQRYYAAAAAGDGPAACSLIYSVFAESIPEDYDQLSGTPAGAANSCAVVMSNFFEHRRRELRAAQATLKVAAVRVRGHHASVLLSFGGNAPKYYLGLHWERGTWKIGGLLATEQPIYVE
jgi:hypothetical protein